jgi:murein DD-endopeptidase MepM/ murein hydrolase activator NlpD
MSGATKFHNGIDLAMPVGDDVPAARAGEVISAGELPGYGKTVVVKHDDTTSTRYAHLSTILVTPGDMVAAGQTIARSGASGKATGPHLHFEVLRDGRSVDPYGTW